MARIRSVHPDLCASETMAALGAELERTFVRLWTHCDDDGRCADNSRLVKAGIYPLNDEVTPAVLDAQLDELCRAGLILRYVVDGQRVLAIRSWEEFQHPQRPRPSKFAPPDATVRDVEVITPEANTEPSETVRVHVADGSRTDTRRVADVYVPGVGVGVGEGEGEGVGTMAPPVAARNGRSRAPDPVWDELLAACGVDGQNLTKTARGAYNRAASELRALDPPPGEITRRANAYRLRWPEASLTPTALARRWPECDPASALEHVAPPRIDRNTQTLLRIAAEP